MLAKRYRITSSEFKKIKLTKAVSTPVFLLKFGFDNTLKLPKVAMVVSKKISKKATVRNNLKRKISAVLEKILKGVNQKIVLVVYPKDLAMERKKDELVGDFLKVTEISKY